MEKLKKLFYVYRARFIMSLKMYTRYPVNFIMTFIQPLIWLTPFYFMGKAFSVDGNMVGFQQYTGNSNFMGFIVVGYIVSGFVSTVFWSMGFSIKEEMRQGVLESNWTAPVGRITLILSKSFYYMFITVIEQIIVLFLCKIVFGFTITGDIIKALVFFIPGLIGMFGLGLGISALVLMAKNANPIIDLSNSIISGFSGSFFPIRVLKGGFIFISLGLPLTYVYDSMRVILLDQSPLFKLETQLIILWISAVVFCIAGAVIFKRVEKMCRTKGLLNSH